MEILKFKPEYLKEVILIERECFPEKEPFPPEIFLYIWRKFKDGFLIAKEGNEILGFGICKKEGEKGLIFSLAVRRKEQGKKIGTQILKNLLENLKKRGIKVVELHVKENNERAIKFYQKFGFEIKEKIQNYYSDKSNAFLMTKVL